MVGKKKVHETLPPHELSPATVGTVVLFIYKYYRIIVISEARDERKSKRCPVRKDLGKNLSCRDRASFAFQKTFREKYYAWRKLGTYTPCIDYILYIRCPRQRKSKRDRFGKAFGKMFFFGKIFRQSFPINIHVLIVQCTQTPTAQRHREEGVRLGEVRSRTHLPHADVRQNSEVDEVEGDSFQPAP